MAKLTAWIADCHVQDRNVQGNKTPLDYTCQAAVWADSFDSFRVRLNAHLGTVPYKLLWIEECHEAVEYIKRHGQQARIGGLARAVHAHHLVELGPLTLKGDAPADAPVAQVTFKEALLALDYKTAPVFAVLDGAQFDNLPKALFDGNFISRPLYLDRGENDPDQIITAPHMVTLDERAEKVTGRPYAETVKALLELIDNKPAAVFWQCLEGANALFRHLRGINMVQLPSKALAHDDQAHVDEDHVTVLFRHSDANALAQVFSCVKRSEAARLFGPATRTVMQPNPHWCFGRSFLDFGPSRKLPIAAPGMLRFSTESITRLEKHRENGLKEWAIEHFSKAQSQPMKKGDILEAFSSAREYLFEEKDDIWEFIELQKKFGKSFEVKKGWEAVLDTFNDHSLTAKQRIFYATLICSEILEGK